MSRRALIFHPLVVLLFSLLGAALYAVFITLRFPGGQLSHQYFYVVPIVVPFVSFLFDRAEKFRLMSITQLAIDALIVITSVWRALGHVPLISGHALFLTYGVLSTRARVAQVTSALVLLQVIYLKYIAWHDWVTSTSGIVLGIAAALVRRKMRPRHAPNGLDDVEPVTSR